MIVAILIGFTVAGVFLFVFSLFSLLRQVDTWAREVVRDEVSAVMGEDYPEIVEDRRGP